jgi:phage terminase Nu1 subunit (DNA packaging protein)
MQSLLSVHLNCDEETIVHYEKRGVIARVGKTGRQVFYDQDDCRNRVLKWLREQAAGRRPDRDPGAPDPNIEKAKLARSQTRQIDLKIALMEGRVVDSAAVQRLLELEYRIVTERLLGLATLSEQLEPVDVERREVLRAAIHDRVIDVLNELSAPAAMVERASADLSSAEGLSAAAEPESDPVGRRVSPRRGKNQRNAGKVAH